MSDFSWIFELFVGVIILLFLAIAMVFIFGSSEWIKWVRIMVLFGAILCLAWFIGREVVSRCF
jgi:NADH:ubiquinone oxidoreductase subunit 6 (subunit J)